MIALLINSLGCEVGRINATDIDRARQYIAENWLPLLSEGDTIRIVKIYD